MNSTRTTKDSGGEIESKGDVVRRVTVGVTPVEDCVISQSEGYSLYAALLAAMRKERPNIAEYVHGGEDDSRARVHNSGLSGRFESHSRGKKRIFADCTYDLQIGIADPRGQEIYQTIAKSLGFGDGELTLEGNQLEIESVETESASVEELFERAKLFSDPTIRISFDTPTVLGEVKTRTDDGGTNRICTLYPERQLLFSNLLRRWNTVVPEKDRLGLDKEDIRREVALSPLEDTYSVYPIVVYRSERADGDGRTMQTRKGFVGQFEYSFKGASEETKNAVTALALFGEASGVGGYVTRGCGHIKVEIED